MSRIARCLVLPALLWWSGTAPPAAADFVALGPERDPVPGEGALDPALAATGQGFVIVWRVSRTGEILAQRTDFRGRPVGPVVEVRPQAERSTGNPDVGSAEDGSFVVAWTAPGSVRTVEARAFDATGAALGPAFEVGLPATSDGLMELAAAADGSFVVAWAAPADVPADQDSVILTRGYRPGAVAAGDLFRVNTTDGGDHHAPAAAISPLGRALYVWRHETHPDLPAALLARVLDSDAGWLGPDRLVATDRTGSGFHGQRAPSAAPTPDGGFLVAWGSFDLDEGVGSIFSARLPPTGETVGEIVEHRSPIFEGIVCDAFRGPFCDMDEATVTVTRDGEAAVGWIATVEVVSRGVIFPVETRVELVSIGADGGSQGPPVRVDERRLVYAGAVSFATGAHDRVLASWRGYPGVRAISLARPVFADDFESGGTDAWAP